MSNSSSSSSSSASLSPIPPPPADPTSNDSSNSNSDDFGGSGSSTSTPDFDAAGTQFSPSMAIILVVLLSAFFFMGFFSIYVKRCTGDEDTFNQSRGGGGGTRGSGGGGGTGPGPGPGARLPVAPPGLDPSLLQLLPLVAFSASSKKKPGSATSHNVECVVCLTDFEENEPLRQLPKCKHVFHQDCIDMWLYSHTTCPLCRRPVVSDPPGAARSFRWAGSASSLNLFGSRRGSGSTAPTPDPGAPHATGQSVAIDVPEEDRDGLGGGGGWRGGGTSSLHRSHSTGHSLLMRALSHTRLRGTPPLAAFVDRTGEEGEIDLQRSRSEAEGRRGGRGQHERMSTSTPSTAVVGARADAAPSIGCL